MIITISGMPGSGKDTIGRMLADKLGMNLVCIGNLRRDMAKKRGMSLEDYNKLGETDPSTDHEADKYSAELGKTMDNFILIGRTGYHFIPHSFKVYLDVSLKEAAKRIHQAKRADEGFGSVNETYESLVRRQESDAKRYKKYYRLDVNDKYQYDLVVDTTGKGIDNVFEEVLRNIPDTEQ